MILDDMAKMVVVRASFDDGTRAWLTGCGYGDEWFTDDAYWRGVFHMDEVEALTGAILDWFAQLKREFRISYPEVLFEVLPADPCVSESIEIAVEV